MMALKEVLPAFKNVLKNPRVYVPDLFMYVVTYILTIFFYRTSGIEETLKQAIMNEATRVEILQNYLAANWFQVLISAFVFVIVTFFIGVGVEVVRYRMIKNVILKKKMPLLKAILTKNTYFFKVVLLKIYVYILSALMLAITTIIIVLNKEMANDFGGVSIKLLTTLIGVAIILFIKMGVLYRYAIMFLTSERSAFKVLKKSFLMLIKRPWMVVLIWFFIALVGLGIGVIASGIGMLAGLLHGIITTPLAVQALSLITVLAIYLVKLTYDLWTYMFVFRTYNSRKKLS